MKGVSSVTVALVLAMVTIAATNVYLYTTVTEKQEITETTTSTIVTETTTIKTATTTPTTTTPEIKGLIEEPQTEVNGYIVQLKETSILKKKLEVEKDISQVAVKIMGELTSRLEDQKSRITSEHQIFLTKASNVLIKPEEKVIREFKIAFNGIVLDISRSEAE